ncbi:hypothetical protein BH09PSE2_BH09PSE2_04370 [soil metagenome]
MAAERSNLRGVATGLLGSLAVLLIAAVSLSRAHADTTPVSTAGRIAPMPPRPKTIPTAGAKPQAEWLRKLLSPSDLMGVERANRRG